MTTATSRRTLEYRPLREVIRAPRNPNGHDLPATAESIRRHGFVEPVVIDQRTDRLVGGHGRLDVLSAMRDDGEPVPDGIEEGEGDWLLPCVLWCSRDDAEAEALLLAMMRLPKQPVDDLQMLYAMLDEAGQQPEGLAGTGYQAGDLDAILEQLGAEAGGDAPVTRGPGAVGSLARRFVIPPFSVFDTRQGYWQDRKREWLALGIRSELGRGEGLTNGAGADPGTWRTLKGVNPGDEAAFAIKGRPANGPAEFRTIAFIDGPPSQRTLTFTDGTTQVVGGVATKLFIRKAQDDPIQYPEGGGLDGADPDPVRRMELAKEEHKMLKAWTKDGENPPRPATPNLDAVNAEFGAGMTAKDRRRTSRATTAAASVRRPNFPAIPADAAEWRCAGSCGQMLPVKKFPTMGAGKRASECRTCRDSRRTTNAA